MHTRGLTQNEDGATKKGWQMIPHLMGFENGNSQHLHSTRTTCNKNYSCNSSSAISSTRSMDVSEDGPLQISTPRDDRINELAHPRQHSVSYQTRYHSMHRP